jgi:hypothetical protein
MVKLVLLGMGTNWAGMRCACAVGGAMAPDTDAAARWRALAAEARRVAEELTDPQSRREMLLIAEAYARMAAHADKRNTAKY